MSFAEVRKEVLRMSNSQRERLMNLLLGVRSLRSDKWLVEMERRRRKVRCSESLARGQVMEKYGISEAEIRREAAWWQRGNGS